MYDVLIISHQVCAHILRCFAAASGFEEVRDVMQCVMQYPDVVTQSRKVLSEMTELYRDISRCLWVQVRHVMGCDVM